MAEGDPLDPEATRYRFVLPSQEVYESEVGMTALLDVHPDATITHAVLDDGSGQFILYPAGQDGQLTDVASGVQMMAMTVPGATGPAGPEGGEGATGPTGATGA